MTRASVKTFAYLRFMTRILCLLALIVIIGCRQEQPRQTPVPATDAPAPRPTPAIEKQPEATTSIPPQPIEQDASPEPSPNPPTDATTRNGRFRNVSVRKAGEGDYVISGEARVFEATYSYVVEDGHNELTSGFGTTSAGAPEWGKFSFPLKISKKRPESTLHLVLFESSPKDGSRTHEYIVRLP